MIDNSRKFSLKTTAIIFGAILLSSTIVLGFNMRNAYAIDPDNDVQDARDYLNRIPGEANQTLQIIDQLQRAGPALQAEMVMLELMSGRMRDTMDSYNRGLTRLDTLIGMLDIRDPVLTGELVQARQNLVQIRDNGPAAEAHFEEYSAFERGLIESFFSINTRLPALPLNDLNSHLPAVQQALENIPEAPLRLDSPASVAACDERCLQETVNYTFNLDTAIQNTQQSMKAASRLEGSFFDVIVELDPVVFEQVEAERLAGNVVRDADEDLNLARMAEENGVNAAALAVDANLNPRDRLLVTHIIIIINKLVNFEKAWKLIATQIKLIRTQIFDLIKWVKILLTQAKLIATEIQQLLMKIDILLLAIFDLYKFDLIAVLIFGVCKLDAKDGAKDVAYCPTPPPSP